MSRSTTTMLILVLVPMMGQAAVIQQSSALNMQEEATCRSRGAIRSNGGLHRVHRVDIGGMLAMGNTYYGAQSPHRVARARKALGFGVAKKGRRSVMRVGHTYRVRHSGAQRVHCAVRSRRASP